MNQLIFVNTENQVNHKNEKNIWNYAKIQVLCITSILSNNDNNVSVTLYKTQPKKRLWKSPYYLFLTLHLVLLYLLVNSYMV